MRTWTPADVNAASLAGTTALICAAMFGHLDIIKYLAAERGADRYLERIRQCCSGSQTQASSDSVVFISASVAPHEVPADLNVLGWKQTNKQACTPSTWNERQKSGDMAQAKRQRIAEGLKRQPSSILTPSMLS